MTMICSAMGDNFFAMGDLMLSSRLAPAGGANLPLHLDPVRFGEREMHPVGLDQKAILMGPSTLVLWAGAQLIAIHVARAIWNASDNGAIEVDLPALIAGLDLAPQAQGAFTIIYHFRVGREVRRQYHGAMSGRLGEQRVVCAGTGCWDFLANLETNFPEESGAPAGPHDTWLARLTHTLAAEMITGAGIEFSYGGWFEFVNLEEDCFLKIPYAIKFWAFSEDEFLHDLPLFYSRYIGHDLLVNRLNVRLTERGPVRDLATFRVADPLRRTAAPLEEEAQHLDWDPLFQCHVILLPGGQALGLMKTGRFPGFRLAENGDVVTYFLSPEFIEDIRETVQTRSPTFKMIKPFDERPS